MTRLNPYIHFKGDAREAMEFYKSVFGGKLDLNTFGDTPMEGTDESDKTKIMHAMLEAENGLTLMGADTPKHMEYNPGSTVTISLSGEDEAELKGYWEKLSEGGNVFVPLDKSPWGDTFGMLSDKFGIEWMVNIAAKKD